MNPADLGFWPVKVMLQLIQPATQKGSMLCSHFCSHFGVLVVGAVSLLATIAKVSFRT